jgi:hypothetical protein
MTEAEEKTEFKFEELSERAKQKAREEYTSGDYPGYDWWDGVYEDAVRIGQMLGIEIGTTTHVSTKGRNYTTTNIWFSGFDSQGGGACFDGDYRYAPDAAKHIDQETNDEELLRIAKELTLMHVTQRLQGLEYFTAAIHAERNNSIRTEIRDWGVDEVGELDEKAFAQLMQDFADWIYARLEDENDYLYSDEYVDERLSENDCVFDESGVMI